MWKINTAVISVSDKTGLVEFARGLVKWGVKIFSTGGTAKVLEANGIQITPISQVTGNLKDDYFDGRMKTISFNYESALLYKRDNPEHIRQARELGIPQIDLVVCNLYPFERVTAKEGVTLEEAIENIDIGGPCMVRAAAKNYEGVAIVVEPAQYPLVIEELEKNMGFISKSLREQLMVRAFEVTADYDAAIHQFFAERLQQEKVKRLKYIQGRPLGRYAENWHQKGWLYKAPVSGYQLPVTSIPWAKQVHGSSLGYNNYLDAEAALQAVRELVDSIGVAIIKHTNPCGYATGETLLEAFERAWGGDPVSAFGSVIALTRPLDIAVARILAERFVEVLVAPAIEPEALAYIKSLGKKKQDLRILEVGNLKGGALTTYRFITGGLLEQEVDNKYYLADKIEDLFKGSFRAVCQNSGKELSIGIVTKVKPPRQRRGLYEFALRYVKHIKSNAIAIVREYRDGYYQAIGMGCGQPNRKDSVMLAGRRAVENLKREYQEQKAKSRKQRAKKTSLRDYVKKELASDRVVLVSDAFFPFRDGIDNVARTGVKYVIQPGGSVRDDEVIKAADEYKIGMLFTGVRKFYH